MATLDGPTTLEEICRVRAHARLRGLPDGLGAVGGGRPRPGAAGPARRVPPRRRRRSRTRAWRGRRSGARSSRFNQLHRMLFELVTYELRERATGFFERAFGTVIGRARRPLRGGRRGRLRRARPHRAAPQHRGAARSRATCRGLDRLLEIEGEIAREMLGERKAAIIQDGLLALKQQQLEARRQTRLTRGRPQALARALQREAGMRVAQGALRRPVRGDARSPGPPPPRSSASSPSAERLQGGARATSSSISRSLRAHVAPVGPRGHRQQVLRSPGSAAAEDRRTAARRAHGASAARAAPPAPRPPRAAARSPAAGAGRGGGSGPAAASSSTKRRQ